MTCARCLSGGHCRGIRCDTCSVCSTPRAKARVARIIKPKAKPKKRTKTDAVGFKTWLDVDVVPMVQFYLACGLSQSEILRRTGISRDQVRTVQKATA